MFFIFANCIFECLESQTSAQSPQSLGLVLHHCLLEECRLVTHLVSGLQMIATVIEYPNVGLIFNCLPFFVCNVFPIGRLSYILSSASNLNHRHMCILAGSEGIRASVLELSTKNPTDRNLLRYAPQIKLSPNS